MNLTDCIHSWWQASLNAGTQFHTGDGAPPYPLSRPAGLQWKRIASNDGLYQSFESWCRAANLPLFGRQAFFTKFYEVVPGVTHARIRVGEHRVSAARFKPLTDSKNDYLLRA